MYKYCLFLILIFVGTLNILGCKVTEYQFCNETDYVLSDFYTYYYDGNNILDDHEHGNLRSNNCTEFIETTRDSIEAAAYLSTVLCIFTDDFIIITEESNTFILTGKSHVYCGD